MAFDSRKYFDAAKGKKRELSDAFGATDVDVLKPKDEPAFNTIVARARTFLQGFANLDTEQGAENVLNDAGYSGNVSSVILGSSAPNYDTGMGGSAGKRDEKEEERKFYEMLNQMLAMQRQIDAIDNIIRLNTERIQQNTRKMQEIQNFRDRLDTYIDGLRKGRIPERERDGSFKDKEFERKLKEYEERTGKKLNRDDADELRRAIHEINKQEENEQKRLADENRQLGEDNDIQKRKKDDIQKDLDRKKSEHPDVAKKFDDNARQEATNLDKSKLSVERDNENVVRKHLQQDAFGDLNGLNDVLNESNESSATISLNKSAASEIDGEGMTGSLKGSFKTARGELPNSEASQSADIAEKSNSPNINPKNFS